MSAVRWFKMDFSRAYDSGSIFEHPGDGLRIERGCISAGMFLTEMNWHGHFWSTKRYLRLYRLFRRGEWEKRIRTFTERQQVSYVAQRA
jgi:hypothetical protein